MKRILLVLALLVVAAPALAVTYTLNTTPAQEAVITRARLAYNATAIPASQYANNGAFLLSLTKDAIEDILARQKAEDVQKFDQWRQTATDAQKNAVCVAAGLAAGCLP